MLAQKTCWIRKMLTCGCRVGQEDEEEEEIERSRVTGIVDWLTPCIPLYESIIGVRKMEYINLFESLRFDFSPLLLRQRIVHQVGVSVGA